MAEGGFNDFEMQDTSFLEEGEYHGETFEDINDVEDLDTLINTYQEESNSFKDKYNNEKKPEKLQIKV